ncbi:MAG TPA: DHH family phosphoesterase [Planctomycetota bacterium]|nr:DHH family phosphoesterase [Planctomycetota bacterium]
MKTLVIADHRVFYGIFVRAAPAASEAFYLLEKGERTPFPEIVNTFRGDPGDAETYAAFDPAESYAVVLYLQVKADAERVLRTVQRALPQSIFLFYGTEEKLPQIDPAQVPHALLRPWEDTIGPRLAEDVRTLLTTHRVMAVRELCAKAQKVGILLQHDPDPDAIASGLCLRNLVGRNRSSAPMLTFGGVTRPENREMLRVLDITIEEIVSADLADFDLLAMVDVQPPYFGELLAGRDADVVIDHHPEHGPFKARYRDVRASYGATSTILTEYMRAAGEEPNQKQATALLYGVKSDTLFLGREVAQADLDAFQYLYARANLNSLRRIERPALPIDSLRTFGDALQRLEVESGLSFAFLGKVEREDVIPQLADLLLQVEGAEWSVAAGISEGRLVASVRNPGYQRSAGAVVKRVFGEIGSAGGHRSMAKAVIPLDRWEAEFGPADERSVRKVFYTLFMAEATRAATSVAEGE